MYTDTTLAYSLMSVVWPLVPASLKMDKSAHSNYSCRADMALVNDNNRDKNIIIHDRKVGHGTVVAMQNPHALHINHWSWPTRTQCSTDD